MVMSINVYLETGKKRVIASAVDWPGWCRSRQDEPSVRQALVDYGPRYAQVLRPAGIEFLAPADESAFVVIQRWQGNATTDFGVPALMLDADRGAVDAEEHARFRKLLLACWQAFDGAVQSAASKTLRQGPRGGGRDTGQIVQHVFEAEQAYISRLGWKQDRAGDLHAGDELKHTQQAALSALEAAVKGELPTQGPRGGVIWPPRYFVRRVAWHVLDHAWEIEDRVD
jgi:hypothetical protein